MDESKIVSMVEFNSRLYMAKEDGVFIMTDAGFERIKIVEEVSDKH